MENEHEVSAAVSQIRDQLDDNWNVRKHLVEKEFDLRSKTDELLQAGASRAEIDQSRKEQAECDALLAKNSEQYEALITAWLAEAGSAS
jgi:hypothetical protein